jgi:hypothetical protein
VLGLLNLFTIRNRGQCTGRDFFCSHRKLPCRVDLQVRKNARSATTAEMRIFTNNGSDWFGRKPCGRNQTHRYKERENDRKDKEVSPAQNRDGGKAEGERPGSAAHQRQSLCRKAT